jgi:hypothetical protein
LAIALVSVACDPAKSPTVERSEVAEKWFKRAQVEFGEGRVDDASEAVKKALAAAPEDEEVRVLGGRIALARLEFDESLRLLRKVPGSEAKGLRGRAHWYLGDLGPAADELEGMLEDPDIRDEWAKSVAQLARKGTGRTPFSISGAQVAAVDMANVQPAPFLVIPVELDGEQVLAMLATGIAEVVVDSSSQTEPSWISLRFGGRLEVTDVPALTQDLSGISKLLNAPIRALIGSNLLRRVHATMDYAGHQFVARAYAPPPPPHATRVTVYYAKSGGMMMTTSIGGKDDARASFVVDSAMRFPIALDERGWIKAGVMPNDLQVVPSDPSLKEGIVPVIRFGALDLRKVPGVLGGASITDLEQGLRMDIDGVIGTPILANYRVTLAEGGRTLWFEDDTGLQIMLQQIGMGAGPTNVGEGPPTPAPAPDKPRKDKGAP